MSEVTSSLGVVVKTGEASAELAKLRGQLEGAATGVRALGMAVKTHAGAIQSMLSNLSKGGFRGLSTALDSDVSKATRTMQTFQQKMREGFAAAGLGAGKSFGASLATNVKAAGGDAVRQASETVRRLESEIDRARPAKLGGSLGGGLSSSIKQDLDKVPAMYAEMFSRVQNDVEKGLRVNMSTLRGISGPFNAEMQAAITKTLDYERQMIEAHGMNMKTQKKQENALFAALEKEKLSQQKRALDQWVAAEKAANAQVAAIRREYVGRISARELDMGRGNLQAAIATRTGAGLNESNATLSYRDGFSAFGAIEKEDTLKKNLNNAGDAADKSKPKLKAWSDEAKLVHDTARGAAAGVGYLWMTWGNIGVMAAGFTAIRGMSAGIKELANIEKQLTFAAQAGGGTVEGLSKRIMDMYGNGQKMVHTAGQMSEALKNLTLAGFSTDDAFRMLTSTYKFAAAGELDLAEAAKGVQQTMNSFSLPMSETGRVTDVLAKAAAASAVTIADMVEAMKTGSVVGGQYGASVEDFATSAALLGKVGIVGSAAGTAIKNFYTEIATPKSKAAQDAIKQLGLNFFDASNKLKPLGGLIDELRTKFKSLSATDQKSFLEGMNTIFNERGVKLAVQAVKATDAEYEKLNSTLAASAGFVDTLFSKLTRTTGGIYSDAQAQGLASLTLAIKTAEPAIKSLGEKLVQLASSQEFRRFLATTLQGLALLTQLLVDHGKTILTVASAYAAFKVSSGILTLLSGRVVALVTGMTNLARVVAIVTAGKAALMANTAGLAGAVGKLSAGKVTLLGALGGVARVLPVIGGLLTAGTVLWALWGSSAESAAGKARKSLNDTAQASADLIARINRDRRSQSLGASGSTLVEIEEQVKREAGIIANLDKVYGAGNNSSDRKEDYARSTKRIGELTSLYQQIKNQDTAAAVTAPSVAVPKLNLGSPDKAALAESKKMEKEHLQARVQQAQAAGKTLLDELKYQQALGQVQETEFNKRSFEIKEKALLDEYNLNLAYYNKMRKLGKGSEAKDALTKVESSSIAIGENRQEFRQQQALAAKRERDSLLNANKSLSDKERETRFNRDLQRAPEHLKGFYTEWETLQKGLEDDIARAKQEGREMSNELITAREEAIGNYLTGVLDRANELGPERLRAMMDEFKTAVAAKTRELDANVSIGLISKEAARDKLSAFIRESGKELQKLASTDLDNLIDGMSLSATAAATLKAELAGVRAQIDSASKTTAYDGLIAGVKAYGDNVGSVFENMKSLSQSTFKSMEDALTEWTMTGKLNFKSLARTVLEGLARIAAQQAIMTAVDAFGGGSSKGKSSGGSGGGIDWGGIVKTVGSWIFSAQGNVFTGTTGLSKFTNSIVTQPTAFAFAKGGVPNMGLMGEKPGSPGEAIMPLSRMPGGDLGVKVMGAGSKADNTISVSFTFYDNRTQSETTAGSNSSETSKRFADMAQAMFYNLVTKEMRPGGMLS